MKKVVSLLCFIVALAMAENTIDLSNAPLSYEVQKPKSNWVGEVGIGYIVPHLKAKQEVALIDTQAFMHGVDIFTAFNYYVAERFGFSLGAGAEFAIGSFKQGLFECNYEIGVSPNSVYKYDDTCSKNTKAWQLASLYFHIGLFADILKFEKVSVRAFSNIGFSFNYLIGNSKLESEILCVGNRATYNCARYVNDDTKAAAEIVPISFGLRFIFAKNHGIELVGKYYHNAHSGDKKKGEWHYTQQVPSIITEFSRDYSFGIRYVYEFR